MTCPEEELLSVYSDREASLSERARVRIHAVFCARCRISLRLLSLMKADLVRQPIPSMPEELRRALEGMAAEIPSAGTARGSVGDFRLSLGGWRYYLPRAAMAFATACAVLAVIVWRVGVPGSPGTGEIPLDEMLAAHDRYSDMLPLAQPETLLAELPEELTKRDSEEADRAF